MILETTVDGERIIPGANGRALVASHSQPGKWYAVTPTSCDCPGFVHRGACRHQRAVADYVARNGAPAIVRSTETVQAIAPFQLSDVLDDPIDFADWRARRRREEST